MLGDIKIEGNILEPIKTISRNIKYYNKKQW
jgi:hypothetical protein